MTYVNNILSPIEGAPDDEMQDLLIIGAGPVGLFASYYAGFRGLTTTLVDSLSVVGGQITAMYPEKLMYDIAGFPAVRGRDLVAALERQASVFDQPVFLGHQAVTLRGEQGDFTVTTDQGATIRTRTVLLTGGIGTFTPRPCPVGEKFLGHGLSYFVTDPEQYRDQDVVVLGGGDSAVDWALMLEVVARSVTLVHRRARFRAHAHSVTQLEKSSVRIMTDAQVTSISGGSHVELVVVKDKDDEHDIKATQVVSALGFIADLGPLTKWGLEMRERHIAVDQRMHTSRPGVFAAGDLTDFDGKVRLLVTGFGEAATAVNHAAVLVHPEESLTPAHSSDQPPGGVA